MFNSRDGYGWVSRLIHWAMAAAILGMFALGLWMRDLDYYSPYYKSAPDLHKSIGLVLLALLVFRFVWRLINQEPASDTLTPLERRASAAVHWGFYPLLLALMAAGYFISTADGRPITVFGLVDVPALVTRKGMEATAGLIHYWLAFSVIGIAALHAAAALYHHFVKRDDTLRRMTVGRSIPRNKT